MKNEEKKNTFTKQYRELTQTESFNIQTKQRELDGTKVKGINNKEIKSVHDNQ